jgi:hypothetical protein
MKRKYLFFIISVLFTPFSDAQGLLNKLKNKANQEVNKLEKGATSSPQGQGSQPNHHKLSANVTRSVLVKLNADEIFDYSENCIDLGAALNQISFIVTKRVGSNTQCYAYRNGTRTSVACPTGSNSRCQTSLQCSYSALRELEMNGDEFKKYVANETESHTIQQPTITDQQMKMMAAYMTPVQLEEVKKNLAEAQKQTANQSYSTIKSSTITHNGKKFGPFQQVVKFCLTADGGNFYAIVGERKEGNSAQMQNKMITSSSDKTIALADFDTPLSCLASSDNSDFGYVAMGTAGQKYLITTSSGKAYDMPLSGGFGGAWFSDTGNHLIYLSQSQLYRDGQVIKTFTDNVYVKACDLFVSSDGTGVTIIKDNIVSFADGDHFEYPLKIIITTLNGKSYYKWLALENQEVVVYEKPN